MKVLHVITSLVRGGAENHLATLAIEQARRNILVTILYLKSEPYWYKNLDKNHVRVASLGMRYYGDVHPIIKLRSLIKELKPDIIHAHLPPAEIYTRLALLGLPSKTRSFVISKHNDGAFYNGFGQNIVGSWVAKRAKRIIAISNAVKNNNCIHSLNCQSEKIATIYYGIDPTPYECVSNEEIQKLRSFWSVTDNTYLIGTVARLVPQKALHILLEGFSLYLKTATKPTKLVIVGVGALESNLKMQAVQLGIKEEVIWAGFREDIPVVMNALDLFALTSVYEGLGLVLLEAMSAGKPVVATNISAIPEVVTDGVTGILFSPNNPVALAQAFQFFEDEKVRLCYGIAGSQRIVTEFTLDRMIEQTFSLYEQCM